MKCVRKLGATDVKYKIICAGSAFDIGAGEHVRVSFMGKSYMAKMHSKAKGRIDGLGKMYSDFPDILTEGRNLELVSYMNSGELTVSIKVQDITLNNKLVDSVYGIDDHALQDGEGDEDFDIPIDFGEDFHMSSGGNGRMVSVDLGIRPHHIVFFIKDENTICYYDSESGMSGKAHVLPDEEFRIYGLSAGGGLFSDNQYLYYFCNNENPSYGFSRTCLYRMPVRTGKNPLGDRELVVSLNFYPVEEKQVGLVNNCYYFLGNVNGKRKLVKIALEKDITDRVSYLDLPDLRKNKMPEEFFKGHAGVVDPDNNEYNYGENFDGFRVLSGRYNKCPRGYAYLSISGADYLSLLISLDNPDDYRYLPPEFVSSSMDCFIQINEKDEFSNILEAKEKYHYKSETLIKHTGLLKNDLALIAFELKDGMPFVQRKSLFDLGFIKYTGFKTKDFAYVLGDGCAIQYRISDSKLFRNDLLENSYWTVSDYDSPYNSLTYVLLEDGELYCLPEDKPWDKESECYGIDEKYRVY